MIKPSRRTRDMGNAVVRRTTMVVAALCLVGTGAVAALQAKAYGDSNSSGGTQATGSAGLTSQNVVTSHDSHTDGEHDNNKEGDDHGDDGQSRSFSQPAAAPTTSSASTGRVVSGGS